MIGLVFPFALALELFTLAQSGVQKASAYTQEVPFPHSNMTLLGKLQYRRQELTNAGQKSGRPTIKSSYYFLSENSAAFYTADSDCKNFLSPDAHLVCIETKEELDEVNYFLSERADDALGESYWIGGRYNSDEDKFVWYKNEIEFGAFLPWDSGMPDQKSLITAVYAYVTTEGLKLRTENHRKSQKFICELPIPN